MCNRGCDVARIDPATQPLRLDQQYQYHAAGCLGGGGIANFSLPATAGSPYLLAATDFVLQYVQGRHAGCEQLLSQRPAASPIGWSWLRPDCSPATRYSSRNSATLRPPALTPMPKIMRSMHEGARDLARAIATTDAHLVSHR